MALAVLLSFHASAASPAGEAAFAQFWAARDARQAAKAADAVARAGVTFDEALTRLKTGRKYAADVPRGIVRRSHTIDGVEFPYTLDVPDTYTPSKRYQVRVQLHGGVGRPDATPRGNGIGPLAGAEQIYVLPTAWAAAEWWTDRQLENVRWILDSVKRTYDVDENRVVLSGVSDGGTGAYYFGMREGTLFASFLPLNGALAVLRNLSLHSDGELFPNNFLNTPFFIVNGGRDPLYPASIVEPFIEHVADGGVEVKYLLQPQAGHNTSWWPDVKDTFEAFVRDHPRDPLPDNITWESDLTGGSNRAHWLVIDALSKAAAADMALPDLNQFGSGPMPDFGLRVRGTRVTSAGANSNASIFDFQAGDVIVGINGEPLSSDANALERLSRYNAGTVLKIRVMRDDQPVDLSGVLIAKGEPRVTPLFRHSAASGRVDLVRDGNTVRATTRGIGGFTLLLSPDTFDLSKPVTVIVNGKTVFDARVATSVATLLKWAARDTDRTMLFGAELPVKLAK